MRIGFLGGGHVGGTLGEAWARKGHEVVFGVRKPDAEEMKITVSRCHGRGRAGSSTEAAEFGEVIVNALPWPATQQVLRSLNLRGKVLLDATNPLSPDLSGLAVSGTTSGGELVAEWAPGARVVKMFNSTGFNNMADPVYKGEPIPTFYCGDDDSAKKTAAHLAAEVGFAPVDAGPLSNSRLLEPLAMLWIWLAYPGGLGREFAFQIVKR